MSGSSVRNKSITGLELDVTRAGALSNWVHWYDSLSSIRCLVSLGGEIVNMSQFISATIFDSIFPLQSFPGGPRTYQLSQLVNSEVCTSLKEELVWPWVFETEYIGIRGLGQKRRLWFYNQWCYECKWQVITTASAPVTPNKCITFHWHCRISKGVVNLDESHLRLVYPVSEIAFSSEARPGI